MLIGGFSPVQLLVVLMNFDHRYPPPQPIYNTSENNRSGEIHLHTTHRRCLAVSSNGCLLVGHGVCVCYQQDAGNASHS